MQLEIVHSLFVLLSKVSRIVSCKNYIRISNFRCSSHCLMIEKGRSQNFEHSLRFCPLCLRPNAYVIEDEFHFFFVCPIYKEIRNIYFKPDWIRNIITTHKFYEIMSRADTSSILAVSKFLLSAFRYGTNYCRMVDHLLH